MPPIALHSFFSARRGLFPLFLPLFLGLLLFACCAHAAAPAKQDTPGWMPPNRPQAANTVGESPFPVSAYPANPAVSVNSNAGIPQTTPTGAAQPPPGTPPAAAQKNSQNANSSFLSGINVPWSDYLEALALVCFALAVLLCALWLFKRLVRGGLFFQQSTSPQLRVENRLALDPKKWILIVRADDKRLVLGMTDQHISLLTEIPLHETAVSRALPDAPVAPPAPQKTGAEPAPESGQNDPFAKFFEKSKEDLL